MLFSTWRMLFLFQLVPSDAGALLRAIGFSRAQQRERRRRKKKEARKRRSLFFRLNVTCDERERLAAKHRFDLLLSAAKFTPGVFYRTTCRYFPFILHCAHNLQRQLAGGEREMRAKKEKSNAPPPKKTLYFLLPPPPRTTVLNPSSSMCGAALAKRGA